MATFTGTSADDRITEADLSPGVVADPPGSVPSEADDSIDGRDGNDLLAGGGGRDTLIGGAGNDTLSGGAGVDTVSYATATSRVIVSLARTDSQNTLGAGVDQLTDVENLVGSAFNDILFGTAAAERIDGAGGNDTLYGGLLAGSASTIAPAGADTLSGGDGDDVIFAGTDVGLVDGGNGRDVLVLNGGGDVTLNLATCGLEVVLSSSGDDTLDGSPSAVAVLISGGNGNDSLGGGSLGDVLLGGAGGDTIVGGDGANLIDGGDGTDSLDGGRGSDTVSYGRAMAGVSVSLANSGWQDTGGGGTDRLAGFEILEGSLFNDSLVGSAARDTLIGDTGDDTLDGGAGADRMNGGSGNDLYFVDDAGDSVHELARDGSDTVMASVDYALDDEVEGLFLVGGAVSGTGNSSTNLLIGNADDNWLSGLANNDVLDGDGGNDTLFGGTGLDWLVGGGGDDCLDGGGAGDTMLGGAGNDVYFVDSRSDRTTEAADEGIDTVVSSVSRQLGANLENLILVGTTAVDGSGNGLANMIVGNGSSNVLAGGGGNDTLTGGGGADVFRFSGKGGTDLITDFTHGEDVLDLSGYRLTFADLDATTAGGSLWINLAAAGPGAGVIVLAGVASIEASDVLLG